mmetsp:Transcript_14206/g.55911  ORF Transcript_14206/g.55911 Transcript_14206/m.55911 type:complete len:209 (-) Transcript_14206:564-1190(-)
MSVSERARKSGMSAAALGLKSGIAVSPPLFVRNSGMPSPAGRCLNSGMLSAAGVLCLNSGPSPCGVVAGRWGAGGGLPGVPAAAAAAGAGDGVGAGPARAGVVTGEGTTTAAGFKVNSGERGRASCLPLETAVALPLRVCSKVWKEGEAGAASGVVSMASSTGLRPSIESDPVELVDECSEILVVPPLLRLTAMNLCRMSFLALWGFT